MVSKGLINANPIIYEKKERRVRTSPVVADEYAVEPIDQQEVFDILSPIALCCCFLCFRSKFEYFLKELLVLLKHPESLALLHHIRDIKDPEHPYSLEELKVIAEDAIEVDDQHSYVKVTFTPTVEHCSMATVIGLCLRVKLMRSLPSRYKVDICVAPGSHATEAAVNKQLNDKERVAAALENPSLVDMVDDCLAPSYG